MDFFYGGIKVKKKKKEEEEEKHHFYGSIYLSSSKKDAMNSASIKETDEESVMAAGTLALFRS